MQVIYEEFQDRGGCENETTRDLVEEIHCAKRSFKNSLEFFDESNVSDLLDVKMFNELFLHELKLYKRLLL